MKKITMLHIFTDDKFFDATSDYFDTFSSVDNLYIFFTLKRNYKFKYIKNIDKIKIIHNFFKYIKIINSKDVDVIYFQGGHNSYLINFINSNKTIIWWCWGYEIYNPLYYKKAIIPLELYKPLTKKYRDEFCKKTQSLVHYLKATYGTIFGAFYRKKFISRVTYFSPVLPVDYILLRQNCKYFTARPYMYYCGPGIPEKETICKFKLIPQNVIIGNSLTYENNHLDIFNQIKNIQLGTERKFIFPVSYGGDYGSADELIKISEISNAIWLKEFMDKKEYYTLLDSVTHAIYGNIRQQAMGNILWCLRNGVKVFLYKDSVIYRQLSDFGYRIFSIEDDLCQASIESVLSSKDAENNCHIFFYIQQSKKDAEYELQKIVSL